MFQVNVAAFILNEVNKQSIAPQTIEPGRYIPGRRSRRTGRILTPGRWQPARRTPYAQYNVVYIYTIKPLPPQWGKYYGHTSMYTS